MAENNDMGMGDVEQHIMGCVMSRIAKRRMARARMATAFHGTLVVGAIAFLFPAIGYTAAQAGQSGFLQYVSLIASDGLRLAGTWPSLIMSLAQSAPIMGSIISLALVVLVAYAARKMVIDMASLRDNRGTRGYQIIGLA